MTSAADLRPCVVVTGSSRGLGAALAREYLARDQLVIGCARGAAAVEHANYRHFELDVSDDAAVVAMFATLRSERICPRLLINNAGLAQSSLSILTSGASARRLIEVNLLGAIFVTREALKLMQRQRFGRVVNLSSINVPLRSAGSTVYNASKAGLAALGQTLAAEYRSEDITVNTLGLSVVQGTGMADGLSEDALKAKQQGLLKPAMLDVAEVVAAIDYLASPLARNVTGQTLYFGGVA